MGKRRELTAFQIKGFAIAAMLLDHIARLFVPSQSAIGFLMHLLGRTTASIMCFFLVEGYLHTRDLRRYALRLAVFAAISYLPYILFSTGAFPTWNSVGKFNVLYTLLLSLGAVAVWDRIENGYLRLILLAVLCLLATLGDWSYYAILFALSFFLGRRNFSRQAKYFSLAGGLWVLQNTVSYFLLLPGGESVSFPEFLCGSGVQAGVFLCLPLLSAYRGRRGGSKGSGWFFYLFYPAHLLLLYGIWLMVQGT